MEIWKQELTYKREQVIEIPSYSILSVGEQYGGVAVWFKHDCDGLVKHCVRICMTGEELGMGWECARFLGTVMLNGGAFVLHVFVKEG